MQVYLLSRRCLIERARSSSPRPADLTHPPRRWKELCEVFTHPITKVWDHDLAWKVVDVVGAHTISYKIPSYRRVYWDPQIRFITIDVVRFKNIDEAPEDEDQDEDEDEETGRRSCHHLDWCHPRVYLRYSCS